MNISYISRRIRKGHCGTFRPLKPGELIEAADVIVADTFYDFPAEQHIGQPATEKDRIIRFEFTEKGSRHTP